MILKTLDKIWSHHIWTIIKWPFGIFLCYFILMQIWLLNADKNYSNNIIKSIKNIRINIEPSIFSISSDKIKNIK